MNKKCNICGNKFIDFLSLGMHPCADTFLKTSYRAKNLKKYPLVVGYCKCSHLSSIYPVPKFERYEKYQYSYTSDNSKVSRLHFKKIASYVCKKFNLNKNCFVVEAGSNDGTFLYEVKKNSNAKVLGVDPSKNISRLASKKKIRTMVTYFNLNSSKKIIKNFGYADVLYGANVFNHVDDNLDFLNGARHLLKKNGILILEVPDLNSLIYKIGFDTIYHEHRHYFSEKSINRILKRKGFYIKKVEKINYMSGSIRVFASKNRSFQPKKNYRFITLKEFSNFKKKTFKIIKEIKKFVQNHTNVVCIGAATKGNTLLNCCKFTDKNIKFIVDSSKYKINKYTPGSSIKIIKETKNIDANALLILPWNITNHLLKKNFFKKKMPYTSILKEYKNIK